MPHSNLIKRTGPWDEVAQPRGESHHRSREEPLDDLPEPDAFAGAEDSAAADELLASMADEAIDRLLAGETDPVVSRDDERLDELLEPIDPSNPLSDDERAALVAAEPDESADPTEDELDALLRGDVGADASAIGDHATVSDLDDELELDAVTETSGGFDADAALEARPAVQPAKIEPKAEAKSRISPWLLPLVWLNAPLNRAPDGVRDAVGKIALVTLLNSAAVFVFVLLRR